jgi:hypothetical protein
MSYPETIVISVTSHGVIIIDNNTNKPLTFNVPSDMKIIKLSAVTPGVCNLTHPSDVDDFIKQVIKRVNNQNEISKLNNDPINYVKTLADLYKNIEEDTYAETVKEKNPDYDVKIRDDYVHHRNKSYNITQYNSNDLIINKEYIRNNKTELNSGVWDFQINVLNLMGIPDLFNEILGIRTYKNADSTITLQQIVDFVKTKGVKQLVILDLSCSNFESTMSKNFFTNRQEREIKRDIYKSGLNGGKRKSNETKKYKRKYNKNTKKNNRNYRNKKYKRI